MPHELPDGKKVLVQPGIIANRPELCALIGQIANEWNIMERAIERLYAILMGRTYAVYPWPTPPGKGVAHPVALQIFSKLESFRAKQNLFEDLLRSTWEKCPEKLAEYKTATERPVQTAYRARNRTVHMIWGICDDYPDALISQPATKPSFIWRKNDFTEELKKIDKGLAAFNQATLQISDFAFHKLANPC